MHAVHTLKSQLCGYARAAGDGGGTAAQMWAVVDGPGLLRHFKGVPHAVAQLSYRTAEELVLDIWAFMRDFMGDTRFDTADCESWPRRAAPRLHGRLSCMFAGAHHMGSRGGLSQLAACMQANGAVSPACVHKWQLHTRAGA